MNNQVIEKYLLIAREAATVAGKYLANYDKDNIKINSCEGKDIKISADKESENIIIDILKRETNIAILSEEIGLIKAKVDSDLQWVVDPLDGSINYFRGIPISCVSIALCHRKEPIIGVIYDYNMDELFTGINGIGAWLNGNKISVSETNSIGRAILFTGIPSKADLSPFALGKMVEQIREYLKLRWIGSAALSLAYIACGRGDVYMENGIYIWDVAAGLAIVAGAGGKYCISETDKPNIYNVCATNNKLTIIS